MQINFLDLDIQQDKGVEPQLGVLAEPVVPGRGAPGRGEEDHREGLPEGVELQAGAGDGGEDGGVVEGARGDGEGAGAEEEVGVCCCAGGG